MAHAHLELCASFWSFSLQNNRAEIARNEVNLKLVDEQLFNFHMERDLKILRLFHLMKLLTDSLITES